MAIIFHMLMSLFMISLLKTICLDAGSVPIVIILNVIYYWKELKDKSQDEIMKAIGWNYFLINNV